MKYTILYYIIFFFISQKKKRYLVQGYVVLHQLV